MKEIIMKIVEYIIPSLVIFFAPVGGIAVGIIILVLLDTILGIRAAALTKQKITSRKMSAVLSKLGLYMAVLYLAFPVDHYLINELMHMFSEVDYLLTKIVALSLVGVEIKSINENIIKAYNIDLYESLKKVFTRAKELKEDVDDLKN